MSQSSADLKNFIDSEVTFTDLMSPCVLDKSYSLPTRDWVVIELGDAVRKSIKTAGLVYEEEQNDCDDFSIFGYWIAFTAMMLAKQKHRQAGLKTGLAVGLFGYVQDNGVGHAICFAIVREDGNLKMVFIEPQSGREKILSQNEKDNCLIVLV